MRNAQYSILNSAARNRHTLQMRRAEKNMFLQSGFFLFCLWASTSIIPTAPLARSSHPQRQDTRYERRDPSDTKDESYSV